MGFERVNKISGGFMYKQNILEILHQNKEGSVSVSYLASEVGIPEKVVENEIETLIEDGYDIEASNDSYQLVKSPNVLLPYEIQNGLKTSFIGREIHQYKEVDSTNNVAKELAMKGASEGTIVIAESQRSGKGRRGKKWVSPSGGVWMSIILHPDIPPSNAPQLTLATGVAVAKTLNQECRLDVGIKWPNDILIGNKKVCGILTEGSATSNGLEYVVVGIGIDLNVDVDNFPPELRDGATSIKSELEKEISGVKLVQKFLENFEEIYNEFKAGKFAEILKEWRRLSKTIGTYVEVHKKGRVVKGEAVGINRNGNLILEMGDGSLRKVISGECIHYNEK